MAWLGLFLLVCTPLAAQMTVSGTLTGTVNDPGGNRIAGAKISLNSARTGEARTTQTNDVGVFNFNAVQPDTYELHVTQGGFKSYEQRGVVVSANERVALPDITLQIGEVTETVSVSANVAPVQTDSSEHSASLTTNQLQNLTARGRDVVSMLRTVPGVQYQSDQDSVGGSYGTGTPNIGGAFSSTSIVAVDGVVSNDMGTPSVFSSVTTLDAIGEVKVILDSYQAEYAGNGGAVVQVVSKSGGKEFHGSGYYYVRNEALNANDFFNNRNSVRRPRYRYNTMGGSIGGPVYIPGKWNQDRSKLFFFYNLEQWLISIPGPLNQYTVPTGLERTGDFSQTLDLNGKVIPVNDPAANNEQFPGNVIPKTRQNPNGLALLGALPLPNFLNRAITGGNYNYQIQEVQKDPKRSQLFRVDYVPTEKDRFFVRGKTWNAQQEGYAVAAGATPVGFFGQCYCFTESGLAVGDTHVFTPTIVMEVNAGVRHNHEAWFPYGSANEINKVLRSGIGYTLGQWFPQSNANGFIPRYSFGGVPNAANVSYDSRLLTGGTDFTFNANVNLSITRGSHNFKIGWDIMRMREYEGEQSTFSGTFDFGKNVLNPLDTNYAYSNAALGVFNSYTESNSRYGANMRQTMSEWFVQDSWKVTRRFNLDYGVRWTYATEMYTRYNGQQSEFARTLYNVKDAPPLYTSVTQDGVRYAQNPLTGALLPAAYVGLFVPGVGNPAPGGISGGDNRLPVGFVNNPGVLWGPRLGFAYDVFGNGKTAIRGGGAILYNARLSKAGQTTANPPATFTPITYYGDMRTFLQTAGVLSPSNTQGFNLNNKTPDNYNITFGVQQDMGHQILVDVKYLGVLGQHIPVAYNINVVPYGTHFLPQYAGLTDNFFRPFPGYNNISWTDNAFNSNYHALLLTLNRRFSQGLQFGFTYTYSKFLDYTFNIPLYRPLRTWSYGVDGSDQRHNAVVNFSYEAPKLSRHVNGNRAVKWIADDWVVSGIAQFVTGTPVGIGLSTVQGTDLVGGGDGQRVNVVGNPFQGGNTFYSWFNPAAFAVPGRNDPGNASKYSVRNPGVNNFDLALSKRFPVQGEKKFFQLRWEAYNAFNHTQYSGINASARYDLTTGSQVNALFGQVNATRTPRIMQGSLRFTF